MSVRIYELDVVSIIADINELLKVEDSIELSCAYGGYKAETCRGHYDLLSTGYTTKRDLYFRLAAFLRGLQYV